MSNKPMLLLFTKFSPFSRKVILLAHERELIGELQLVLTEVGTHVPLRTAVHDQLALTNPLMKIPVLIAPDIGPLFDSRTICEYLDSLHGGEPLFPTDGRERWAALQQQALADGIMDAAILARFEGTRPEPLIWSEWATAQTRRITQGLDAAEAAAAEFKDRLTIGQISMAAALGYLDFRFDHLRWRDNRSGLAAWYEHFSLRPSMQETKPAPG
jgi:glutathione S-transferase